MTNTPSGTAESGGPGVVRAALWTVCGLMLVAQLALPWTSHGPLSSSSSADALRLLRSGTTGSLVPPTTGYLVLLLPASGITLIALAWLSGQRYAVTRLVAAAVGAAMSAAYLVVLVGHHLDRLAPAAWATLGATATALVLAVVDSRRPRTASNKETRS